MNLLEIAHAQEQAVRERQRAEEEELELALARSLEESLGVTNGAEERAPPSRGPSVAAIDTVLPAMPFRDASGFLISGEDGSDHECAVCLADLQGDDQVRVLHCMHVFHVACVDKWFSRCAANTELACPTCKQPVPI